MTAGRFVDLNADVGEGCGQDAALMRLISSANIACGYHAGDAQSMHEAVALSVTHGVAVGAHPSFPDREHFGRRELQLTSEQIRECVIAQVRWLMDVARSHHTRVCHVKPHGALYNMAARDEAMAEAIVDAVRSVDPSLILFGLAGSALISVGQRRRLRTASEVFADRGYRPDGTLLPRDQPGSVLHEEALVAARAVAMVRDHHVSASDGTAILVEAETICVHGDTPGAAALAARIREALQTAEISVTAPKPRP